MAQFITVYQCPDCLGKFKWPREIDPPTRCQLCDSWMLVDEPPPVFEPKAPMIRNGAKVRAVDDVYYGLEDATRANAERMAEMTPGASASDFAHTRVTDMNDRQKPGDIAWKPPPGPNVVAQQMEYLRGRGAASGHAGGSMMLPEYAWHIAPWAGKAAAAMIQEHHMKAGGQPPMRTLGTYMPPRS